jgi:hypothetical protein
MRLLFGILLCLQSSCISVGIPFEGDVVWIAPGKTKRSDIVAKMGEPFRVGYDSGFLTFTYAFYRYSLFSQARTKDLLIRFEATGIVHSYSYTSSFEQDKQQILK